MFDNWDDVDEYDVKMRALRPRSKANRRLKLSHKQMKAESAERAHELKPGLDTRPKLSKEQVFYSLVEENAARRNFNPTLGSLTAHSHMSNHETEWILNYLGSFYELHLITDVIRRVKAGKEATVYCCRADPETGFDLLAGKVYHERMFRSLKNDAIYREGRSVLDDRGKGVRGRREALAMEKKTKFGQDLRHVSWLTSEFLAMERLYAAGADIPRPIAQSDNAILMEYVGDELIPAPTLINVDLSREEAKPLFDKLIGNIDLMLSHNLVHGDLSAHNVLFWDGQVKIIDFPQAVDPIVNAQAYNLLLRDVTRICQYFAKYGVESDPVRLTTQMWSRYTPE